MSRKTRFLSDDQFAYLTDIAPDQESKKKYKFGWPRQPGADLIVEDKQAKEMGIPARTRIRPDGSVEYID